LAAVLILAMIAGLAMRDDSPQPAQQPKAATTVPAASETNAPRWHDDIDRLLTELDDDTRQLDERAGRLWDSGPASLSETSEPGPQTSTPQEIHP
jgi:hypothetical protein